MNTMTITPSYSTQEKLRIFKAFQAVQESGKYNMIMDAGSAALEAGLARWEYNYVIKHYEELYELAEQNA